MKVPKSIEEFHKAHTYESNCTDRLSAGHNDTSCNGRFVPDELLKSRFAFAGEIKIRIYKPSENLPKEFSIVLIEGGIGRWNGANWETMTGFDAGRAVEWEVEWWAPLIFRQSKLAEEAE